MNVKIFVLVSSLTNLIVIFFWKRQICIQFLSLSSSTSCRTTKNASLPPPAVLTYYNRQVLSFRISRVVHWWPTINVHYYTFTQSSCLEKALSHLHCNQFCSVKPSRCNFVNCDGIEYSSVSVTSRDGHFNLRFSLYISSLAAETDKKSATVYIYSMLQWILYEHFFYLMSLLIRAQYYIIIVAATVIKEQLSLLLHRR